MRTKDKGKNAYLSYRENECTAEKWIWNAHGGGCDKIINDNNGREKVKAALKFLNFWRKIMIMREGCDKWIVKRKKNINVAATINQSFDRLHEINYWMEK